LVPAVFILTNRIFSPQFVVVLAVAWLVAGALVCRTRREQLALATAVLAATSANALVYPALINLWLVASTAFFLVAAVLTGTLLAAIARHDPDEGAPPLSPPAARRPPRRSPHPENG
jgi:CHASE2 domain-containing sensor protein